METKFQTSFIPKASLAPSVSSQKPQVGLLLFIATILFIASLIVAGGAFGYRAYLQNQEAITKTNLDKNVKAFEPETIQEYVRLEARINTAKNLLTKHVAATNIFDYLTDATLKSVRFTDFKYDLGTDGSVALAMNGQANSYNAVAYQSQVLGAKKELKNPIFSNLDLDDKGNVVFSFSTTIDPGFVYYTSTLNKRADTFSAGDNSPTNPDTSFSASDTSGDTSSFGTPTADVFSSSNTSVNTPSTATSSGGLLSTTSTSTQKLK